MVSALIIAVASRVSGESERINMAAVYDGNGSSTQAWFRPSRSTLLSGILLESLA